MPDTSRIASGNEDHAPPGPPRTHARSAARAAAFAEGGAAHPGRGGGAVVRGQRRAARPGWRAAHVGGDAAVVRRLGVVARAGGARGLAPLGAARAAAARVLVRAAALPAFCGARA